MGMPPQRFFQINQLIQLLSQPNIEFPHYSRKFPPATFQLISHKHFSDHHHNLSLFFFLFFSRTSFKYKHKIYTFYVSNNKINKEGLCYLKNYCMPLLGRYIGLTFPSLKPFALKNYKDIQNNIIMSSEIPLNLYYCTMSFHLTNEAHQ